MKFFVSSIVLIMLVSRGVYGMPLGNTSLPEHCSAGRELFVPTYEDIACSSFDIFQASFVYANRANVSITLYMTTYIYTYCL